MSCRGVGLRAEDETYGAQWGAFRNQAVGTLAEFLAKIRPDEIGDTSAALTAAFAGSVRGINPRERRGLSLAFCGWREPTTQPPSARFFP